MPRPPRPQLPNGVYHVGARGVLRSAIFVDDDDRRTFLGLLRRTPGRFGWSLHAYCLMSNHYHLVVETPLPNISAGMHWVNGVYARSFNDRHVRSGHVFERRFWADVLESEDRFAEACRYVLTNPVRAGLCERVTEWPWSGSPYRGDDLSR